MMHMFDPLPYKNLIKIKNDLIKTFIATLTHDTSVESICNEKQNSVSF